jgi:uncharacterized phage protein gp47/JayE
MAGITATGFVKKTLAEIKAEREASYRQAFGASINLQPPSNFATIIGIESEREAKVWDLAEECWNSRSRSGAQGVSLDNVGELTATERLEATKSQIVDQIFFGDVGTVIDTNVILSVVGNPTAKFKPDSSVVLEAGTNEVQTLTFSGTPASGVWSIVMPDAQATANLAFGANAAAVQAAINALEGWEDVTVSGNYGTGFVLTFAGSAGKQPWANVTTTDTLQTVAPAAITITVTETTPGVAQATAKMIATEVGPVVAAAGTLSVIDTPVTGLTSTKNLSDADLGRLVEEDADYRIRQGEDVQKGGATIEAIRTVLKNTENVPGVKEVIVFQNNTLTTDGDGRPPKSVQIFVDGGENQDIGDTIWYKGAAGGIETFGDIEVEVVDSQGLTQLVYFNRPVDKNVYVTLDVVRDTDAFPTDGSDQLKENIVEFGDTLKIGDEVLVYPKLLPAIVAGIPGITDISIKLGFSASPTLDDNLTIAANERAKFDTSRIIVNLT